MIILNVITGKQVDVPTIVAKARLKCNNVENGGAWTTLDSQWFKDNYEQLEEVDEKVVTKKQSRSKQ